MSILLSVFPFLEWVLQASGCCSGSKNHPTFGACASKRVDSVNLKHMEAFLIFSLFRMSLVKKREKSEWNGCLFLGTCDFWAFCGNPSTDLAMVISNCCPHKQLKQLCCLHRRVHFLSCPMLETSILMAAPISDK